MACDYVPESLKGGAVKREHLSIASEPMKECRLGAGQHGKKRRQRRTKSHRGSGRAALRRQEKKKKKGRDTTVGKKLHETESQRDELKDLNLK